jgi:neurofibromin 1
VDGLVALYRANPSVTSSTIFSRLWIDSDISRNIAVKACAIIAREHQALPWQPSIDSLRNESAPQIRQAFKGAVNLHTAEREPHHPRTSLDNSPVLADIIQQTLELYKTHPEFAFTPGPGGTEIRAEDVDSFFLTISALFVRPERSDIRLLAGSILEVTLEYLVSADVRRARPAVITPYAWQSLLNASAQILLAFHAGDSEELVAASQTYREVSLMFAHYITSLDDTFFDNSACDNACTVAAVAGLIAFTGADPEQYLLVLPAMSALNEIARKRNLSQSGDEATKANARLLEEIAGLRPVRGTNLICCLTPLQADRSGRQQQQKQLRGVIRANRDSSTMLPIVWIGLRHRLDDLMAKMGRSSSKTETGSPAHAVGAPGLTDVKPN